MRRWVLLLGLVLGSVTSPEGTVGMAEWEVYTPGGYLISHVDGWKEEHGDCLRTDPSGPLEKSRVLVSHLRRWRYHEGYVAGESAAGYFLLDEGSGRVELLPDEGAVVQALRRADAGRPLTGWLTGADGWREAWYPFFVWGPCSRLLLGDPEPRFPNPLSVDECREAMAPHVLELHRRTTWGRTCREAGDDLDSLEPDHPLRGFCREMVRPDGR